MATNYPTSLDAFVNPLSTDSQNSPSHSLQHANANDAIEAIEAKLGFGTALAGSATTGAVLVASTGGTTSWTTVGTASINSTLGNPLARLFLLLLAELLPIHLAVLTKARF
jgi:hypothetical protein